MSKAQLAKVSGVPVRSIQLFERRKSNITNAQYNHLSAIAKALGCEVEDLLEEFLHIEWGKTYARR